MHVLVNLHSVGILYALKMFSCQLSLCLRREFGSCFMGAAFVTSQGIKLIVHHTWCKKLMIILYIFPLKIAFEKINLNKMRLLLLFYFKIVLCFGMWYINEMDEVLQTGL